jgi:putative SOS response-associated peptidase YedK
VARYRDPFICRRRTADELEPDVPKVETLAGMFGLPRFKTSDEKLVKETYNCRSETAAAKPSFRDTWMEARHYINPVAAIYGPAW